MKTFIQGLTLTSFVLLMSAFVLYRGGYFNTYLTSPNGGVAPQKEKTLQDTIKKKKRVIEINEPKIMPSSKSGIIFKTPADTTKPKAKPKRPRMMSGSKSGEIFIPEPIDSTKKKKKSKK